MHQQRGLARRGRALERRRGHSHDHTTAPETRKHVTQRECSLDRIELVAAFEQSRRRRRIEVGAERDHQHVGVERPRIGFDPPRRGVDRAHGRLHEAHTGLDEVAVRVAHRRRAPCARTSRRAWRSRRRSPRPGRSARRRHRRRALRKAAPSAPSRRTRHPIPRLASHASVCAPLHNDDRTVTSQFPPLKGRYRVARTMPSSDFASQSSAMARAAATVKCTPSGRWLYRRVRSAYPGATTPPAHRDHGWRSRDARSPLRRRCAGTPCTGASPFSRT